MNSLKLLSLLLLFSSFAMAETSIWWKNRFDDSHGQGFRDSSFFYYRGIASVSDIEFCFVGQSKDVCPIISQSAEEMQRAYRNGGHDTMEVLSCKVENETVTTLYLLHDDYNAHDLDVTRVIKRCLE
ncbi:MAG: hypothetical protein WCK49_02005 [Myxococcaceae bacterium]